MFGRIARWIVVIALVLAAGFVAVYQFRLRPVRVAVHQVAPGGLLVETMGTGALQARVATTISVKISGRIAELAADQEDRVDAGQVLVRLDDDALTGQVRLAEARVAAAQAAITRLQTERDRALAVLASARREHERTLGLHEKGMASETERDQAIERLGIAQAELARAEASILEGRKSLVAEERSLDFHRAQLAETVVRSPFAGLIVRRDRDPGDVVVPGSAIYRLIRTDNPRVSVWVDETAMAGLEVDQPARIVLRSEPDVAYAGRVERIGREVDPELREFVVDLAFDQPPPRWAVGQRAEAYVAVRRVEDALAVPVEFLAVRGGREGLWVERDGRAEWRLCAVGQRGRDRIQIIEGVRAGERVLRPVDDASAAALRPDRRVTIR